MSTVNDDQCRNCVEYIVEVYIYAGDLHACHLVQPSNRSEYEISEAIDLLFRCGRTIDAIELEGWRIDIGYPEDRDEAEEQLQSAAEAQPVTRQ